MLGYPSTRRGTSPWTVVLWILLGVAAVFAILAFIFALIDANRENFDESAILAAIATVQDGVTSLLASVSTLLTTTSETLSNTEEILELECIPLFEAGQELTEGCYYFAQSIECAISDGICFLVDSDVDVDQRGFDLLVTQPDTVAYSVYFTSNARIRNGRVYTGAPSNISTSRVVDAFEASDVVVEGLVMSNFFRPVVFQFSDGLTVDRCSIDGAYLANANFGSDVIRLVSSSNVDIVRSKFFNTNPDWSFLPPAQHAYPLVILNTASGTVSNVRIDSCQFVDTGIWIAHSSETTGASSVSVTNCDMEVTDPLNDNFFVGNAVFCATGTQCATVTGFTISDNRFTNLDASPGFDGIILEIVDGYLIERNVMTMNSDGFDPHVGITATAHIHICYGNSFVGLNYTTLTPCRGGTIRANELLGAAGNSTTRATNGIVFEAGTVGAFAEDNQLTGFGPGQPSNGTGTYPACLTLQSAYPFAIVSAAGVTNTGNTAVTGSVATYPGTTFTNFPPGVVEDGTVHLADSTASSAKTSADELYACMLALPCDALPIGNLGGRILTPGVYCYTIGATLTGTLVLNMESNPNSVFVFKIDGVLTISPSALVTTSGGSSNCDVFWQVTSSISVGAGASLFGNFVSATGITMGADASIDGRLMVESGTIVLDDNEINGTECPSVLQPAYPAQTPAAIWVRGGASCVHLKGNSIKDVACSGGFGEISGEGIRIEGEEVLTSWAPPGSGLVTFPPAYGCTLQDNQVSCVCGACAFEILSSSTDFYGNDAHANNCSYYAVSGAQGIVQCFGDTQLVGWNLDGDCI